MGVELMNGSVDSQFTLLGLSHSHPLQLLLVGLVSACYTASLLGNLFIVVTVLMDPNLLQSPMYFFLANLSLIDMALGSVAAHKLLSDLLSQRSTISYGGCMAQLFFLHFLGGSEMFLLTLMACDCYVAICHPLSYAETMHRHRCLGLLATYWAGGLLHSSTQLVLVAWLPFCGPSKLDNFYCDVPQVVKLACSDTYVMEILIMSNSDLISLVCFLVLLGSYCVILVTLRGRFGDGDGRKALYTCSAHLMMVSLILVPCIFVYLRPFSSFQMDKMASIFYIIITPVLNPIIYTLRNQEIKEAMKQLSTRLWLPC
ncbi:olfactory receptor 4Q3-like [Gopherus flavomarginatus]|uniref:olfactory receptor 4Q3-like n=1 Tax=Gopherus flavomarginatus TaxID=286002 RepID=UPI0021CBC3E5|nr:olfactory receptor 4Q3-like [Gopherus flavomarginatus]